MPRKYIAHKKKVSSKEEQKAYEAGVIKQQRYPHPDVSQLSFTFFQSAITAFLEDLRRNIRKFLPDFPIYIFNTGDEVMTLNWQDTIRTETYQEIPRMVCDPGNLTISSDQLTSPYQRGEFVVTENEQDKGYSAYVRRIPVTLPIDCTVTVSNIIEQLKWQEVILLLLYKNNQYHFQHYKKDNKGVYRLPDDQSVERNIELGFDDTRRNRTITFTINIDLQYPAFDYFGSSSLFAIDNVIKNPIQTIYPDPTDTNDGKKPTPGENGISTDYGSDSSSDASGEQLSINSNYGIDVTEIPGHGGIAPKTGDRFPDGNGEIKYDAAAIADELGTTALPREAMLKVPQSTNSQEPLPPRTVHRNQDIPTK